MGTGLPEVVDVAGPEICRNPPSPSLVVAAFLLSRKDTEFLLLKKNFLGPVCQGREELNAHREVTPHLVTEALARSGSLR